MKSYVIRGGRLTTAQERALKDLSPKFCLPLTETPPEWETIFANRPLCVEIGFGDGASLAETAAVDQSRAWLGIEVYPPGVGKLLLEIERRGLENVRIVQADAVLVVKNMLKDASVSAFHIFFPDPWPKKRHHKRRLLQKPFTDLLFTKLLSPAYIHIATDWAEYASEIRSALSASGFTIFPLPAPAAASTTAASTSAPLSASTAAPSTAAASTSAPLAAAPFSRPLTRFERKGLAASRPIHEIYARK